MSDDKNKLHTVHETKLAGEDVQECAECGRRKANARDIIRWRSGSRVSGRLCWKEQQAPGALLLPDEETATADFLRARLKEVRTAREQDDCRRARR